MRALPILTTAVTLVTAAALTIGFGQAAQAAVIQDAITNVTVSPTAPTENSQITTTIDWCVPNGTKEGDTFTLELSSHLSDLPLGFSLDDPQTGAEVATATLSAATPAVITFTMTAYAADHLNTCGSAFLNSGFDSTTTPSGVTTPITFTTGDGRTFSTDITPTGSVGNRSYAIKYGTYTRADQGRTSPTDFLAYRIDTPVGPFDSATTTDTVPAGQDWTFDCSTLAFTDVENDAASDFVSSHATTPVAQSCSPTALSVTWGSTAALHFDEVFVAVSLPAATGVDADPQTFTNVAAVTTTLGGVSTDFTAPASNVQSSAGGVGSGTVIPKGPSSTTPTGTPTTPSTPTATPTPTTTASTPTGTSSVAPAAVTATPVSDAAGSTDGELAFTGSNAALPLGIAGVFVLLGLGLIVSARRRSAARAADRTE